MKVREYSWWASYTTWKRTVKPLAIALSGVGKELGEEWWGQTNVQYKATGNWHKEIPLVQWIYTNKNDKKLKK
jgi:hypothetical protein